MSPQKIAITGGTGFIGQALVSRLNESGHTITILSRNPAAKAFTKSAQFVKWDPQNVADWQDALNGQDVLINLAGANIAGGYWTRARKRLIFESRVHAGNALVTALKNISAPPHTFIQASGIGYYGSRADERLDETSGVGTGFLAEVAREWEAASAGAPVKRQIVLRIGIVLGHGGFLSRVKLPFRFFVGGHFGSGRQWMSWIHLADLVAAIIFLMDPAKPAGIFNLSTPTPVTARDFSRALGAAMNRPSWLHVPEFVLKLLLRDMATELLLPSQRAFPQRLIDAGFEFQFPHIEMALNNLLK